MNSELRRLEREALLSTAAALTASRDCLMTCAELLRDFQFDVDVASRSTAAESASDLINRSKNLDTSAT